MVDISRKNRRIIENTRLLGLRKTRGRGLISLSTHIRAVYFIFQFFSSSQSQIHTSELPIFKASEKVLEC